jgi:hypothetical protein
MTSLLHANLSESDVTRILRSAPKQPLLPPRGSKAWKQVAENPMVQRWMEPLRPAAESEVGQPMPPLTDEMYREFNASGARGRFETAYFERRRRFARAAICALMDKGEAREKWLVSMREKLAEILDEPSWALPAHVKSASGQDPMHIDVFAAETANSVAETLELFGAELPADLTARIRSRLRKDFFENYLHFHRDIFWTKATDNWNAVCHQGVIGAALTVEEDVELLARLLLLAKTYLPLYLLSFGEDGACAEGPAYWQHGFGSFAVLNDQLETRAGGELSLFGDDERIGKIARYGPRVSLSNFHFVNFSDSPRTGALSPSLLTYLGRRLQDEMLLAHGYRSYQRTAQTGLNLQGQRADLFYLVRLFLNCPSDHSAERTLEPENFFFRDFGVLVVRGRDQRGNLWELAAKAGHNAEHHNHNDCGSYLLNINGSPAIIEIGAPAYTKDYFGEKRYEYLAARTLGHSLPIVNGREQSAGPQYVSQVLSTEMSEEQVEFSVELTPCYPPDAQCLDLVRRLHFHKVRGVLSVEETFDLAAHESYETSVITDRPITVGERVATIQIPTGALLVKPDEETIFAGVETQEYRDHNGAPQKVYRLILKPANFPAQRSVCYKIELAGE